MTSSRHPFLDDLAPDAVLTSTALRKPLKGREAITRVIKAGGTLYERGEPMFHARYGDKSFVEYDAVLKDGPALHVVSVVHWNEKGEVVRVNVSFSPLHGALSFASKMSYLLAGSDEPEYFL
jgi:hypothetical protein